MSYAIEISDCYSKLPFGTYEYYDQFSSPSLQVLIDECCYEPEHARIIQEILEERGELLNV